MGAIGSYNYFKKLDVNWDSFGGGGIALGYQGADMVINFTTQGAVFLNEGTGVVEYSFNGKDVHGELDGDGATKGIIFDNRAVSSIWFRVKSGSSGPITASVQAWGTY